MKLGVYLQNFCGENNKVGGKTIFQNFCELTESFSEETIVLRRNVNVLRESTNVLRSHKVYEKNSIILQGKANVFDREQGFSREHSSFARKYVLRKNAHREVQLLLGCLSSSSIPNSRTWITLGKHALPPGRGTRRSHIIPEGVK